MTMLLDHTSQPCSSTSLENVALLSKATRFIFKNVYNLETSYFAQSSRRIEEV
jgi:hypothetical protein